MRLIDAPRCPFCARVRLVLAEKALAYETVEIDLGNRPDWLYELNPSGKVPVLDDGFILPESAVIMEYLEERFRRRRSCPAEPAARARRAWRSSASTSCSATTTTPSAAASRTSSSGGWPSCRSGRISSSTSRTFRG